MPRRPPFVVLAIFLGCAGMGRAADSPATSEEVIVLRRCVLEFERTTLLGAPQSGLLQDCLVKPGDRVKAGQVLGRLYDSDLRIDLELKAAEAENDLEIRVSESRSALASSKLKAAESLNRRKVVSLEDLKSQMIEAETAVLVVDAAKHRRRLARLALRQAEATLRAREIVVPHDGIIVAVLKNLGESVGPAEPAFRVVDVDRVRVTGSLDIADAWRAHAGQAVRVSPDIPGVDLAVEREVFVGRVEFVDSQINPDTQTCKVVAIVENRESLLRSGLEARVEILPVVDVANAER